MLIFNKILDKIYIFVKIAPQTTKFFSIYAFVSARKQANKNTQVLNRRSYKGHKKRVKNPRLTA